MEEEGKGEKRVGKEKRKRGVKEEDGSKGGRSTVQKAKQFEDLAKLYICRIRQRLLRLRPRIMQPGQL